MPRPKKDVIALSRTHTDAAIKTLVGIMNQPKAPAAARVNAAQALLDRGWGKAKQVIEADLSDPIKELLEAVNSRGRPKPGDS